MRVRWTFDLLDRSEARLGPLAGVQTGTGSITRSASASIKASAKLSLVDTGQVEDWTQVRIRPVIDVDGRSWPLGVFIPDVPVIEYSDDGRVMDVDLLDKTTILDGDAFGTSYGIAKGANVAAAVREIIETTGEPATGIEDSGEKLRTAMETEPDDSKLAVINTLLDAANFFSLYTGGTGRFHADPYLEPGRRPVVVEFVDEDNARLVGGLYSPGFTVTRDIGSVPNRVRAVSQSDEDEPALVAEARNEDPESPFSFDRLGYWRTHVDSEVATTSQASLDAYAARRLKELSAPQETVEIEHAPYDVTVNDAVTFTSRRHGIDGLWTVQNQEWSAAFGGLVKSKLRKVQA